MIRQIKSSGPKEWTVYILRCQDGTLYTGIAKNAEIRFKQHQMGKGAAYTRIHPPQKIVFQEKGLTRSEALVREAALKRLPKSKKETLTRNVPRP
ncbi:MAG: hypothetical protein KCHDKBKB_02334 [Elusimicrobia bacterium]|nr:hypothetical protein [Elusimicrobiota bacterium]